MVHKDTPTKPEETKKSDQGMFFRANISTSANVWIQHFDNISMSRWQRQRLLL